LDKRRGRREGKKLEGGGITSDRQKYDEEKQRREWAKWKEPRTYC
jgi:hypothetical protein